ncbi:hypothetical protein ACHAXA_011306 [Cyclostephanos tholiformis]|uniref:Peptidase S54 rhomboid domain-containing protein n=1 Tax=Cyclostephanos tholiformis TaxID=382380 RepID=A0ABD3RWD0_9STRA
MKAFIRAQPTALLYLTQSKISFVSTRHRTCCARKNGIVSRDCFGLNSSRENQDESPPKSNRNKGASDEDSIENDMEIKIKNEFIDFDEMEKKVFDDLPEYGTIRSLEPPYENYNPIDPLSVDDIEFWMEKINLRNKGRQKSERSWSRMFPWVSPLASILLPGRHYVVSSVRDGSPWWIGSHSNNFSDDFSSPKLIRAFISKPNAARDFIVTSNVVAFIYQIITAVWYLPGFNRVLAASVAGDAYAAAAMSGGLSSIPQWTPMEVVLRALGLIGGGAGVVIASGSTMSGATGRVIGRGPIAAHSMGPFFLDYAHQPYPLSSVQKHRYLSSAFLHGSLLHLGMNLRALLSLPLWLENGIGKGVYLSAYIVSIVTGNTAQTLSTLGDLSGRSASSLCIGASGGICGLYGLMLASLLKMGNADAAYYVMKHMLWLLIFGFLVPNVSNAGHLGGFAGGFLIGYLFGPGYERSYTLNRADGFARDKADREFRQMMGPGVYPSAKKAIFPLKYLWMGIGLAVMARPDLRLIPIALLKGIIEPGSLSGARVLLRS